VTEHRPRQKAVHISFLTPNHPLHSSSAPCLVSQAATASYTTRNSSNKPPKSPRASVRLVPFPDIAEWILTIHFFAQEGYDADILNPPTPPPASRSPPAGYNQRGADVESGDSPHEKHLAAGGYGLVEHPVKQPFWKTTKGLIIIAVVALVVIAAAVGEHRTRFSLRSSLIGIVLQVGGLAAVLERRVVHPALYPAIARLQTLSLSLPRLLVPATPP
jgi:hypothetical protein